MGLGGRSCQPALSEKRGRWLWHKPGSEESPCSATDRSAPGRLAGLGESSGSRLDVATEYQVADKRWKIVCNPHQTTQRIIRQALDSLDRVLEEEEDPLRAAVLEAYMDLMLR
ncbi:hypothetical protein NDU88_006466 [Pleurodeles waltl]|uniref:Uncharacterized protein n=1 Tax=Pleurodeles waltl TaxID=8319 RepID=A0AAV7MZC7_PLEWA|nr:hypothetical protein NDU88_006466 [Pleurodeles waltl]